MAVKETRAIKTNLRIPRKIFDAIAEQDGEGTYANSFIVFYILVEKLVEGKSKGWR